jgi:hypothetical protein
MFSLANSLLPKLSTQRASIKDLFIVRGLIKKTGSIDCPMICLTDKSGEEFDPMEYFEFIEGTISNFFLAASLYRKYI